MGGGQGEGVTLRGIIQNNLEREGYFFYQPIEGICGCTYLGGKWLKGEAEGGGRGLNQPEVSKMVGRKG